MLHARPAAELVQEGVISQGTSHHRKSAIAAQERYMQALNQRLAEMPDAKQQEAKS